jgi:hypothetical protein
MWVGVISLTIYLLFIGVTLLAPWPNPIRNQTDHGIVVGKAIEHSALGFDPVPETLYILTLDVARGEPIRRIVTKDLWDRARHGDRVIKMMDAAPILVPRRRGWSPAQPPHRR